MWPIRVDQIESWRRIIFGGLREDEKTTVYKRLLLALTEYSERRGVEGSRRGVEGMGATVYTWIQIRDIRLALNFVWTTERQRDNRKQERKEGKIRKRKKAMEKIREENEEMDYFFSSCETIFLHWHCTAAVWLSDGESATVNPWHGRVL